MRTPPSILALAPLAAAVLWLAPADARAANLDACGNIDVSANAQCELVTSGGCTAMCTPIAVQAACAGRLWADCEGQCDAEITAECRAQCTGDCNARCEANPPQFDCRAECMGDCEGSCNGRCGNDDSQCLASCRGTCSGSCDAHCQGTPPSADCSGKCEASCDGRCDADANLDCQIDCQADGFVDCQAELTGGCEAQCTEPEGALFCDGDFVDAGDQLQQCIDALKAAFDIEVEGSAEGHCSNGHCEGSAGGSVGCAVDRSAWQSGALACGVVIVVAAAGRRRRRR
jgi:hypothetical protein